MEHHSGAATLRGGYAEYESAGERHVETPRFADRLSPSVEPAKSYMRNPVGK
ncbi:hypothetical protein ACNJ7E_30840 [Rhodococcus sp. NM-2]|uniref:hypothetical protein n=1 Tax=Rhodococcus sp. NM-2 TaxID=3401174 RepID=UPI003AABB3E4